MPCDTDIRRYLFQNILLSCCITMFRGLAERLEKDISALALTDVEVKIIVPPERKYSESVLGGSILTSLNTSSTCGSPRRRTRGAAPPLCTTSACETPQEA